MARIWRDHHIKPWKVDTFKICAKDTPTRSFTGWLELTSRLVDLINARSGDVDRDPTTRPA